MSITPYNPDDHYTAGNTTVLILPACANAEAPTVAEINAGYAIQCAIEELEMTVDADTTERKKICDKVATQSVGKRTYQAGDTSLVAEDPQQASPLMDLLIEDAIVYLLVRPGMDDSKAFRAGQRVWVDRRQVVSVSPMTINTDEGNAYGWTVSWAVKSRTLKGTVAA